MIVPIRSWPTPTPRRANPNFKPESGQQSPEKEVQPHSRKATQEKEGPKKEEPTPTLRRANLYPRERRANPKPEERRANPNSNGRPQPHGPIPVSLKIKIITTQSWTNRNPKEEGPTPTSSLLYSWVRPGPPFRIGHGNWPSLSPLFGWLSPLGPGQPRPEGPTLTRKGRANL